MSMAYHIRPHMALTAGLTVLTAMLACNVHNAHASWTGPVEVVSGGWGKGEVEFGIDVTGSGVVLPYIRAISPDGKIVIRDQINTKEVIFNPDGSLYRVLHWIVESTDGQKTQYDIPDDTIFDTLKDEVPHKFDFSVGSYQYDTVGSKFWAYQVKQIDECGNVVTTFKLPLSEYEPLSEREKNAPTSIYTPIIEYGEPVIRAGDIYAYARTPEKYSILKWTWVDDPNTPPAVPGPPSSRSIRLSKGRLLVKWSNPDVGGVCLTGYEISRSDKEDGTYTVIGTAPKGDYHFIDSTAEVGKTYYYKIRAKGGEGYSEYTAPVSGTRK